MISYISLILLAILQGLTEFLPVSSSGHLLMIRKLVGLEDNWWSAFDVAVHVGTLLAVFVYFRRDFANIIRAIPEFLYCITHPKSHRPRSTNERYIRWIIIATIPTALIGLGVNQFIMKHDIPLWFVGIGFVVTSGTLFMLGRATGVRKLAEMKDSDAFFAGLMQGLATAPGISRSGFTITALLMRKMAPDVAVRFSFVAATPAIIGAAVLKIWELKISGAQLQLGLLACGAIVAAIVGYFALALLVGVLRRKWFGRFAYYLVPLAIACFVLSFWF